MRSQDGAIFVEHGFEIPTNLGFRAVEVRLGGIRHGNLQILGFDSSNLALKFDLIAGHGLADFRNQIPDLCVGSELGGRIEGPYTTFTNVYQLEYLRDGFLAVQDLILHIVIVFSRAMAWS